MKNSSYSTDKKWDVFKEYLVRFIEELSYKKYI